MKVLIFGATGTVGCELVTQALEMGHTVTAFARDPSKLAISHASLEVIEGDVMDSAAVDRAVLAISFRQCKKAARGGLFASQPLA